MARVKYVEVVCHGGPMPGPQRLPLIEDTLPPWFDHPRTDKVVRYQATDEEDDQGRRIYKPDPALRFQWEDPR